MVNIDMRFGPVQNMRCCFRTVGERGEDRLGLGIIHKTDKKNCCPPPESFAFFAICLVLQGDGEYVDWETKKSYPLHANSYFLRIPGVMHRMRIKQESNWVELFLSLGCNAYPYFRTYCNTLPETPTGKFSPDDEWCRKYLDLEKELQHYPERYLLDMVPRFFELAAKVIRKHDDSNATVTLMKKACAWLCADFRTPCNIQAFSRENGWGYENFRKKFAEIVGMSPNHYRTSRRIAAARALLRRRNMTVADIAESLGYCSAHEFSAKFKQKTGMTPTEFRNSGEML